MYFMIEIMEDSGQLSTEGFYQPLFEVSKWHPVGESFTADTDTFEYTIAGQLMHDKEGIDDTWFLVLIGDNTTYKVRLGVAQGGHQSVQLFLWINGKLHV